MRRSLIFLLLFAPLIECFSSANVISSSSPSSSETTSLSNFHYPSWASNAFRSLLPNQRVSDVSLVIALDGMIYNVNTRTGDIEWALPSGSPIYTSYQDLHYFSNSSPPQDDRFFVSVGEDGAIYKHSRKRKEKWVSSIQELVTSLPILSEDGGVTVASSRTTVFVVDLKTGRIVHVYKGDDSSKVVVDGLVQSGSMGMETVEQLLYIARTDYDIRHNFLGCVRWNVTFAIFDTKVYPRFSNAGNELVPKHSGVSDSYVPYPMKLPILITRDPRLTESLSVVAGLTDRNSEGSYALEPSTHDNLLAIVEKIPLPPPQRNEGSGILDIYHETEDPKILFTKLQSVFVFLITLLSFVVYIFRCPAAFGKQCKPKQVVEEAKLQAGVPKKKRTRRLGNNKRNANDEKLLLTSTDHVDGQIEGRRIGKLLVSNNEIAQGSNGTIVLEGTYDGRPVAVKRLVRTHHDVAFKEVQNLIASDQHPNIVRWYGVEYDQDFVYLSLERCACSLNDLVYFYSESMQSQITRDQDPHFLTEYTIRLNSIMEYNKDTQLWKANGYPSPQLLKLMSDLVSGLAHLHELGIIHRDLKPQNVLIIKGRTLSAKLSDMGISKRLQGDQSSITQHATGYGSSGWQAPEQLLHQRQTRAVDLFSLGCLLFFCVTGGKHPYGDSIERDVNIVNDRKDLFLVDTIPEAVHLFSRLLDPNPDMRPTALDVLHHPFFWSSETRLSFLRDASDRVELEDREKESKLLNALEGTAAVALNGKWDEKMESTFINNIGRYRRYKFDSVRDLLRVIRNKLNHYRELPPEIQELLGSVPEGFDGYFSSRFPRLLIEVYKVLYRYCREEEFFRKYRKSNVF